MPALLIILVLLVAAGQYQPLVYEGFEANSEGYGGVTRMLSRTCVYFSGYTLVSKRMTGEYRYTCPRRQGLLSVEAPKLID